MALVFLESFDGWGGNSAQADRVYTSIGAGSVKFTDVAGHVKTGTYAMGNASGEAYNRPISISGGTVTFGFWIYWVTGWRPHMEGVCVAFTSSVPYDGFNAVCALYVNIDGTLGVRRGFNPGTVLDTSAVCLSSDALNYIEVQFTFGASGSYIVKCNQVEVLNGSGDMGGTTIAGILFGNAGRVNDPPIDVYALDDFWLLDSSGSAPYNNFLGPQQVVCFRPSTGNGANTGLTPSTGTDHGALVDDAVANDDTDYNGGGAGVKDTYLFDTSILAGKTINGVQLSLCAKATAAGTNTIAGVTRIGGTDYAGSTQAITTSYDYYQQPWGPRPSDGAAWTQADVAEFGMSSIASAGANRLTLAFIEVLSGVDVTKIRGSAVFGEHTTVSASRAVAFGLNGATNTLSEAGKLKVFGNFEVTGDVTIGGDLLGSATLVETILHSIVTAGGEVVVDSDGNVVFTEP